jgi:5,6-dimethylbenzimidazole synthase
MEFSQLLTARRSCRSFDSTPVTEEQIEAILQAGCWAPSPLNLQPWQFIVVTDPGIKKQVKEAAERAKEEVMAADGPGWVKKYSPDFVQDAPLLLVVLFNPGKGGLGAYFGQQHGALQAASACIQNMMLKASELGLESLWFTFFRPDVLRPVFNLPEKFEIAGVITLGKPAEEPKAPPRRAPVVYREKYGALEE